MSNQISVYSLADLKNTTDDALPTYLTTLPKGAFTQSHYLTDVRLALASAAVLISGGTFYLDWTKGWEETKHWTVYAVLVYFALNAAFTYWIWGVERGTVFVGATATTELSVSTRTEKHTPTYFVTAKWRAKGKEQWEEKRIEADFTRWFTKEGSFIAKPFQQWLASELPVVGKGDPANVVEEIGRGSAAEGRASGIDLAGLSAGQLDQMLGGFKGQASGKAKRRG